MSARPTRESARASSGTPCQRCTSTPSSCASTPRSRATARTNHGLAGVQRMSSCQSRESRGLSCATSPRTRRARGLSRGVRPLTRISRPPSRRSSPVSRDTGPATRNPTRRERRTIANPTVLPRAGARLHPPPCRHRPEVAHFGQVHGDSAAWPPACCPGGHDRPIHRVIDGCPAGRPPSSDSFVRSDARFGQVLSGSECLLSG